MFDQRPYRQQRKSVWSIWWFVGLMASGLTAWHLELLPFFHQQNANLSSIEINQLDELELSDDPIAQFANSPETTSQPYSNPIARFPKSRQANPPFPTDLAEQSEPASQNLPLSNSSSIYKTDIQQAGFQQVVPASKEQHRDLESPYFQSQAEFTPVKTLTYRAKTEPVTPKYIPAASSTPPIQPATYQSTKHQPIQTELPETKTALRPSAPIFHLSDKAKQDIVRHRQLSEQYWKQPETRGEISIELERLANKIYFSPNTNYLPEYEVQPNDQLRIVAKSYNVPWEYLANLNQIKPEEIRSGQTLKVIKGPFHAVVDLNDFRITIHAHGYYVRSFSIGTGKDHSTPKGKFTVQNKERNPTYYGTGGVVSRDDPMNPLGEHWIDLGNSYGIHGTINPLSIGQSVSKGCIRMVNADVEQVFNLLTKKSEVLIRQ